LAFPGALGTPTSPLYPGMTPAPGAGRPAPGPAALTASANRAPPAVLAAALLGEPLTMRKVTGLLLGVAGVAIIVEGRLAGGGSLVDTALLVGGLIALVGGTILFKRFAPQGSMLIGNGVQNFVGGLAITPVALTMENVGEIVPSARLLLTLTFLVVLGSIVAYLLWFHLLDVAGGVHCRPH